MLASQVLRFVGFYRQGPHLSIRIVNWILPSDTLFGDDWFCICFDLPSRETAMLSRFFFRKSKFPSAALGKKLETKFPGFWNETGL